MSNLLRIFRALMATCAICAMSLGNAMAAPLLSVTGSTSQIFGSNFTLNVMASDITDLYGYQFDVTFDKSIFSANAVGESDFLLNGGTTFFDGGTIDNSQGRISLVFDTLLGSGPGVSGSGALVYLNFTTVGTTFGAGTFALENVIALDSSLASIAVTTQSLTVSAVPEASTWALWIAGIVALGAHALRRNAAALRGGSMSPA